ncbi:MAG: Crp/Fnr family transcriptional regulator [Planctomycetota bacterium]|jgi:CRP/FNR family transcriptional regulator
MDISELTKGCLYCERQAAIFKHLEQDELIRINESRNELFYNAGDHIIKQGAPATHVLSFTNGLAKVVIEGAEDGIILKLIKPVRFIAGPGFFLRNRHAYSIIALEKSHVCAIDEKVFKEVLASNHRFNEGFLKHVNKNYQFVLNKLISQYQNNTKGRVASTLLYLKDEIYNSDSFNLSLSISDLSSLAAMSKESMFRILKEFSDEKIIRINKKQIDILKKPLLEMISEKG